MRFPSVSGTNLNGLAYNLPGSFEGDWNLVLIAFHQWQQRVIDTWLPLLDRCEVKAPGFRYYELPVIQPMNWLMQSVIDSGMRAGIHHHETRARTITLYIDKGAFCQMLDLHSEDEIYLLLLDRTGAVLWRTTGRYTQEQANQLRDMLSQHMGINLEALQ